MASTTFHHLGAFSLLVSTTLAAASAYAPVNAACPSTGLVRPADGLNAAETAYIAARKPVADDALRAWLIRTNPAYANASTLPTLGLTTSGGGYRSMLTGAGVVQGLDARDSNGSTAGLYQALTYHAGLSGGSWLLSSLAGNDWPTVSSLRDGLWAAELEKTLFLSDFSDAHLNLLGDIAAKHAAGFDTTITDPWGRLLANQILYGPDGGINKTLSGVTAGSHYAAAAAPFPIITALGVETWEGDCQPDRDGVQYEFTPHEFGSWDSAIAAFTPTKYLGSTVSNTSSCVTGFDNLAFVFGTSSSLFNSICSPVSVAPADLSSWLTQFVLHVHEVATQDLFALFPNPFYSPTATATSVAAQPTLHLVDGGLSVQNDPLWPLLHRAALDVVLVNDNSADTDTHWPNGTELRNTWAVAQNHPTLAARMPEIPTADSFVAHGLDARPAFFGCNDTAKLTVVWLPNANWTFESNVDTYKLQYSVEETNAMIANGAQVATAGGDKRWGACLACGIMAKTGVALPGECEACLGEYCWN